MLLERAAPSNPVVNTYLQGKRNRDILLFNGQLAPSSDVQLNRAI